MTSVEINNILYPATIVGRINDKDWNNRESKAITLEMTYSDAIKLFVDNVKWSIVHNNGEIIETYDNSEYSIAGAITDNRDGTVTVKMGKITDSEALAELLEVLG